MIELARICCEHEYDDLSRILAGEDGDEALDLLTAALAGSLPRALLWNHLLSVYEASAYLDGAMQSLREFTGRLVAEEVARQSTPSV